VNFESLTFSSEIKEISYLLASTDRQTVDVAFDEKIIMPTPCIFLQQKTRSKLNATDVGDATIFTKAY